MRGGIGLEVIFISWVIFSIGLLSVFIILVISSPSSEVKYIQFGQFSSDESYKDKNTVESGKNETVLSPEKDSGGVPVSKNAFPKVLKRMVVAVSVFTIICLSFMVWGII